MLRSYRHIIFAIAGFLALAASPPRNSASNPQTNAAADQGPALNGIASAIENAAKPSELEAECGEGERKRNSDLCAQWYAADAARSAANAAWWLGIVGSAIGALTLAAAFAAARWAKKAAIETEKGAIAADKAVAETQRIGEAQTRAYLSIAACEAMFNKGEPSIRPTVRNSGQSPALDVQWFAEVSFMRTDSKHLTQGETDLALRKQRHDIPAQGERHMLYNSCGDLQFSEAEITAFRDNVEVVLVAQIYASGRDVFGNEIATTENFIRIFRAPPSDLSAIDLTLSSRPQAGD